MLKSELLEKLKDIADDANIDETIQGIEGFAKPFDVKSLGLEDFKNVLESNDIAKSYFQSALDSGVGKGVAKYKENFSKNELPKLIDDGIKAKTNESKSPEQIKLEELEQKLASMETEKARAEMSSKFAKELSTKGLPTELIDFVMGSDEDITNANIEKISNILSSATDTKVKEKLGDFTYSIKKTDNTNDNGVTLEQFKKMGYKDRVQLKNTNEQLYTELQQSTTNI